MSLISSVDFHHVGFHFFEHIVLKFLSGQKVAAHPDLFIPDEGGIETIESLHDFHSSVPAMAFGRHSLQSIERVVKHTLLPSADDQSRMFVRLEQFQPVKLKLFPKSVQFVNSVLQPIGHLKMANEVF